jgi:hypothetical protein
MNWGKATIIILLAFVLFISGLSYYMFRSPADEYDHQYYEDGLNFDHDYTREAQVNRDHAQPRITVSADSVKLAFPQSVKGRVKFMRPASDARDTSFVLDNTGRREIRLATEALAKGKWQLVLEWTSNRKAYLYQQEIYIK